MSELQSVQFSEKVKSLADALFTAQETRLPIGPLTEKDADLTVQEAYGIQMVNIQRRLAGGGRVVGHKIGLTAKAMQDLFGVNEPDYGHLLENMVHSAKDPLDLSTLIDPQIEVEPAFVLKKDLKGPEVTIEDVLDATDYISVCFEVIDSRIVDWRIKLQDTVADNGSSALIVMGDKKVKPDELALANLETTLTVDGKVVETGNTSAILGHPANGIAWLANKISQFGISLKAGDIVLPGTCTRSFRIAGYGNICGEIDGMGTVSLNLIGKPTVQQKAGKGD